MESDDDFEDFRKKSNGKEPQAQTKQAEKWTCAIPHCKFVGTSQKVLHVHMSRKHPKHFSCDQCGFVNTNTEYLLKHKRLTHGKEATQNILCKQAGCAATFHRAAALRDHLAAQHDMAAATRDIHQQFDSTEEFKCWLSAYEEEASANFISHSGKRLSPGVTITYKCSRSGKYTPMTKPENRKRRLKSQGSRKLGFTCTAAVRATVTEEGRVTAVVFPFHYGHGTDMTDLAHLRIPAATKAFAKERLLKGVSITRILQDVRRASEQHAEPGTSRSYWLSRRDILNMAYSLNVNAQGTSYYKDKNEVRSVEMYAEEIRSSDQQHLLVMKLPGEEHPRLSNEDFLLGFCSSFQLTKFLEHGSRIVCMDGTHGTSGHDYHLLTVMVLTPAGEGLPVAFAISNREDEAAVAAFIGGLRSTCEELGYAFPMPEYFMSDKAMAFVNGWVAATGQQDIQHLLCSWHVQRAWKGKLALIQDAEARQEVYNALSGILLAPDAATARAAAATLAESLMHHGNTRAFGTYFHTQWLPCVDKWALGGRTAVGVSTNMHVEAFHRVLKYVHLQGRVVKRVDKCIAALQEFVDDIMVRLGRRQLWRGSTTQIAKIRQRHQTAVQLVNAGKATAARLPETADATWAVRSDVAQDGGTEYSDSAASHVPGDSVRAAV